VVFFVAACTLSMASFAAGKVACKGSPNTAKNGTRACAPALKGKSKAVSKSKAVTKPSSRTHAQAKTKGKNKGKAATSVKALANTNTQGAPELLASPAMVDCDSTQILLQGGAAQCHAAIAPDGSGVPTQAQENPGTPCFAALAASNAARRLSPQVPFLSASAASPEALANQGLPNRMEREELGSVVAGYGMCLDMAAVWRKQTYAPALLIALNAYWHEVESVLNELAGGKRNFGDAARAIAESDKAYRSQTGRPVKDLLPAAPTQ
jgi:hypothetical protein